MNDEGVSVIYFTDPLCCWSWGMEPQVRRLLYEFDGLINWRFCMGGLLPTWTSYNDEVNSVTKPLQMGPVWLHAQTLSGMPLNSIIWKTDPPSSSYPCCIAVKCAFIQSQKAGTRYLRLLREAVMIHGKNISKEEIIIDTAYNLSRKMGYDFNAQKFEADLQNGNGLEAFRTDMQQKQLNNITRFPTLIIKDDVTNKGIIVTGYRPYSILLETLYQVKPSIQKTHNRIDTEAYTSFWETLIPREYDEILEK